MLKTGTFYIFFALKSKKEPDISRPILKKIFFIFFSFTLHFILRIKILSKFLVVLTFFLKQQKSGIFYTRLLLFKLPKFHRLLMARTQMILRFHYNPLP